MQNQFGVLRVNPLLFVIDILYNGSLDLKVCLTLTTLKHLCINHENQKGFLNLKSSEMS